MSRSGEVADQASEQGRFAAREFVSRFERETGGDLGAVVRDRMLFAYEVGYLRGHGDGMRALDAMIDDYKRRKDDDESK